MFTKTDCLLFGVKIVEMNDSHAVHIESVGGYIFGHDGGGYPAFQDFFDIGTVIGQAEVQIDRLFGTSLEYILAYKAIFFIKLIFHLIHSQIFYLRKIYSCDMVNITKYILSD